MVTKKDKKMYEQAMGKKLSPIELEEIDREAHTPFSNMTGQTKNSEWWYPDEFWLEAMRVLIFGFIIQVGLILLLGIPNLIFKWSWINYVSWIVILNSVIVNSIVLVIVCKGCWKKLQGKK